MIKVDILGELTSSMTILAASAKEALLTDLADVARAKWINLAKRNLNTTAGDYVGGISEVISESGSRTIVLTGWLPNAIEQGKEPFDLRMTILANPNSRIRRRSADGGWYASVPFRHFTPGSVRGQAMGAAYGERGPMSRRAQPEGGALSPDAVGRLADAVYSEAKMLRSHGHVIETDDATMYMRNSGKSKKAKRLRSGVGGVGLLRPHHTTDIYSGMVRSRHTYERATQTRYMTWRTISTANPEGWIHPGFHARHFAHQVMDHVDKALVSMVRRMFREGKR